MRFDTHLRVPRYLADEVYDAWSLPPEPRGLDRKKAIGDRGEFYSHRLETMSAEDPTKIRWVARDDDGLGYDIEDRNATPRRRIEVKASAGDDLRFILSAREWREAHIDPATYVSAVLGQNRSVL